MTREHTCSNCGVDLDTDDKMNGYCSNCGAVIAIGNQRPLSMEMLEGQAKHQLQADPMFWVEGNWVHIDSLHDELDVVEETAKQSLEEGEITPDMHNGLLVAVAGLRRALEQAIEQQRVEGEDDG